ncbi:MAG TPA: Clp protease N-terminal domain-containing protein [Acidimicrobiia bacterium]|nr:Clp protease N-terminal domain-containing protein [Acidimicrobiia bacterium]
MENPLPPFDDLVRHIETDHPDATALQQLGESVGVARHLGELADHLVGHFVDQARNAGASWAEIGDALGVTKQAAQKRFVPKTRFGHPAVGREGAKSMFERFTDEARLVVVASEEHCRQAGHPEVSTGHILLSLLDNPDGLTHRVLDTEGVSPVEVRERLLAVLGPGRGETEGHIPFATDAKKVLELSLREAIRSQSDHIGVEHVLLGLLRDEKSLGAVTLAEFGVDRKHVERDIGS